MAGGVGGADGGPNPEGPFRSLSYQAIQIFLRAYPLLFRLALLPFVLSICAVSVARWVGPPGRYGFDVLHGLFLLSYITSVARVAQGTLPGRTWMGLAIPGFQRPGFAWPGFRPAFGMLVEALLLMVPAGLFFLIMAAFIIGAVGDTDLGALDVVAHLLPEFLLNTLLGLVIGCGVAHQRTLRSPPSIHD